jgi:hypothetical protein
MSGISCRFIHYLLQYTDIHQATAWGGKLGQQLYPQHPERLGNFQDLRVKLAILKFANCAQENQIIMEVQNQSEEEVKPSAILSCLCGLVGNGYVLRVEDQPELQSDEPEVFYVLSPSGYMQMKSKIWMMDNMNPVDTVWFMN